MINIFPHTEYSLIAHRWVDGWRILEVSVEQYGWFWAIADDKPPVLQKRYQKAGEDVWRTKNGVIVDKRTTRRLNRLDYSAYLQESARKKRLGRNRSPGVVAREIGKLE
jgi:hypothetical protein